MMSTALLFSAKICRGHDETIYRLQSQVVIVHLRLNRFGYSGSATATCDSRNVLRPCCASIDLNTINARYVNRVTSPKNTGKLNSTVHLVESCLGLIMKTGHDCMTVRASADQSSWNTKRS